MSQTLALSSSLEDYLEVIFHLVAEKQVARVKDIARLIHVKNSSVTGALRALAERGLIHYAPYDVVTLTPTGKDVAEDVVRRHEVLRDFFVNVLAVDPAEADEAACRMEHCISPGILERFVEFSAYVAMCPRNGIRWVPGSGYRCRQEVNQQSCERCLAESTSRSWPAAPGSPTPVPKMTLNEFKPGQKGRIAKIRAQAGIQKRILEMGVIPGSLVEVERVAPLGDPLQIKIKGYHLTLRREEAQGIEVVPVGEPATVGKA